MAEELFPFLNNLFEKQKLISSSSNQMADYYMALRFLSMTPAGFVPACHANHLGAKLPKWVVGCLLYNIVPKLKYAPRIKYIKKPEIEKLKIKKVVINKLGNHFCLSTQHAEQLFMLLEKQGFDVASLFGIK